MFYSHEILNSRQYGVATIWLVATVGAGATKKVTKKAIQQVDVVKACEQISEPGAPIALRLQGNLLYGATKVFSQQCGYMLSEAEKVQSDMLMFFRRHPDNATDPRAGKVRPEQITLSDDPNFDPFAKLPVLDFETQASFLQSQESSKNWQLSPLTQGSLSSGKGAGGSLLDFNFGRSSSANSLLSTIDILGDPMHKAAGDDPFADEQRLVMDDFGIMFDEDGNLIEPGAAAEEFPPLPMVSGQTAEELAPPEYQDFQEIQNHLTEEKLLDAEALPTQAVQDEIGVSLEPITAIAPVRAARTKKVLGHDDEMELTKAQLSSWNKDYLHISEKKRKRPVAGPAQVRNNAFTMVFGRGIGGVGLDTGIPGISHPLAAHFAGEVLENIFTEERSAEESRSLKRDSADAFGSDDGRRVRRRPEDETAEQAWGQNQGMTIHSDHTAPEIGMGAPPVEDFRSSTVMPWSQMFPGSATRSVGSAQKPPSARLRIGSSPLFGRGTSHSIDRFSDLGVPGSEGPDITLHGSGGFGDEMQPPSERSSQDTQGKLDIESLQFLQFLKHHAAESGTSRAGQRDKTRKWLEFENLVDPLQSTKVVAAEAFYHVLALAAKQTISVSQDGVAEKEPFGTIHLGVRVDEEVDDKLEEMETVE